MLVSSLGVLFMSYTSDLELKKSVTYKYQWLHKQTNKTQKHLNPALFSQTTKKKNSVERQKTFRQQPFYSSKTLQEKLRPHPYRCQQKQSGEPRLLTLLGYIEVPQFLCWGNVREVQEGAEISFQYYLPRGNNLILSTISGSVDHDWNSNEAPQYLPTRK